jgi:hypothetical protein
MRWIQAQTSPYGPQLRQASMEQSCRDITVAHEDYIYRWRGHPPRVVESDECGIPFPTYQLVTAPQARHRVTNRSYSWHFLSLNFIPDVCLRIPLPYKLRTYIELAIRRMKTRSITVRKTVVQCLFSEYLITNGSNESLSSFMEQRV